MGAVKANIVRFCVGANVTPLIQFCDANLIIQEQLLVDSLAGVALRRKNNDGAQRLAQSGQKSDGECKSIS